MEDIVFNLFFASIVALAYLYSGLTGAVWAVFGLTSWSEVAAALSALYTFFLLLELAFNKFGRPYCEKRGWIKRRRRRRSDRAQ